MLPRSRDETSSRPAAGSGVAAFAWNFLVVAAASWVVLIVIARLRLVLLPLVVAVMIASALYQPHTRLVARGWPPTLAAWTLFALGILLVAAVAWLAIPPIVTEATSLTRLATTGFNRVQTWLAAGHFGVSAAELQNFLATIRTEAAGSTATLIGGILGGATVAGEFVVGLLLAAVLAFFLLKDGAQMIATAAHWAGGRSEAIVELADRIRRTLAKYLEGAAFNGLVNAALTAALLLVLGVPLVAPIAALTFLSGFIPLVGPVVVGVLAGLVALASGGFATALITVVGIVIMHHLEGYLLSPIVFRRGLRLHGAAVVLALATGTVVAGVVGAALSVPALAVGREVVSWYRATFNPPASPVSPTRPGS